MAVASLKLCETLMSFKFVSKVTLISLDTEMALIKLLSCVSPIEKSIGLKRPGISVDKLSNFSSRFSILGSVF